MVDQKKIEKLQNENENLEIQYERSGKEAIFDNSRQDHVYKQLKKKKKELKKLLGDTE